MVDMLEFVKVHNRIVLALSNDDTRLRKIAKIRYPDCSIIEVGEDNVQERQGSLSASLEEIFRFDRLVQSWLSTSSSSVFMVCTGKLVERQIRIILLLGCHLMMSQGLGFEETILAIRPLRALYDSCCTGIHTVDHYLRAVCCAKCLKWIDFQRTEEVMGEIPMDEYIHYSRCLSHCRFLCIVLKFDDYW